MPTMTAQDRRAGVSIIVPTTGRREVLATLEAMRTIGLQERDEVIVVLDGGALDHIIFKTRRTLHHLASRTLAATRYISAQAWDSPEVASKLKLPASHDWGAKARSMGLALAVRPWVTFMDDDDMHAPGALHVMRPHLSRERDEAELEGRAPAMLISRMMSVGQSSIGIGSVLWKEATLKAGNVGTPMLWAPRYAFHERGEELPDWPERYEGDLLWAKDVTSRLEGMGGSPSPIWVPHVTALIRPWAERSAP